MGRPAVDRARYDPIIGKARAFIRAELGIDWVRLNGPGRPPELVRARALFVWIARMRGPDWLSQEGIGFWLGGRDHTTIGHIEREIIPRLQAYDPLFCALCDRFDDEEFTRCE